MAHSPVELLYTAHRRGAHGALRVKSHAGDVCLWIQNRNVVQAEGLRVFTGNEDWLSRPESMSGVLSEDLGVAIDSGMGVETALEQACLALGTYLATCVDQGWEDADWEPNSTPPHKGVPLPWPALRIFTRGLRELRHPDAVADAMAIHWDDPIQLDIPDAEALLGLDVIALRTLKIARHLDTLGELITLSGRGHVERTRHAWRAVDLLLQLRLLRVGPVPVEWNDSVTSPLPDLSLTSPWRPIFEPEKIAGAGPLIEFLPPMDDDPPTTALPDVEIVDDDPSEMLSQLEMDLQRCAAPSVPRSTPSRCWSLNSTRTACTG
jgi:hypothetical protein